MVNVPLWLRGSLWLRGLTLVRQAATRFVAGRAATRRPPNHDVVRYAAQVSHTRPTLFYEIQTSCLPGMNCLLLI